jgi:hypothetical protein
MANYYFLTAALPPLSLDVRPELSFKELMDFLVLNLTKEDFSLVEKLLRPIDLYNIKAFWLKQPLDERGKFNAKDLEEELLVQEDLPIFIIEFLERYESTHDRLRYFSSLFTSLYREEMGKRKGFLLKYFTFERELRLILAALRGGGAKKDLVYELQFEDPSDPLVADILAQKEAPQYSPDQEYEELKNLFVDNYSEPQKLNDAIEGYRFRKIEEIEELQDFSIDRILAYVAKYLIVDALRGKDLEKGKEILSHYE